MVTTRGSSSTKTSEDVATEQPLDEQSVITAEPKSKKKKKKKYSRLFRGVQEYERAYSKSAKRLSNAISIGIDEWIAKRDKSASKKRDGAIKDSLMNISKAVSKSLEEAAKVPYKLLDDIEQTKTYKKIHKKL